MRDVRVERRLRAPFFGDASNSVADADAQRQERERILDRDGRGLHTESDRQGLSESASEQLPQHRDTRERTRWCAALLRKTTDLVSRLAIRRTLQRQKTRPQPRDETSTESPKLTAKPSKYFIARNELNFSTINLCNSALKFNPPGFVRPGIGTVVKGLYQGEGELGSLRYFKLSRLLFELGKSGCHSAPRR
jgi:hypothetical protein